MGLEMIFGIEPSEKNSAQVVINRQLEFYRRGEAGCLFAAHASLNPERFEWRLSVSNPEKSEIEKIIVSAISLNDISTQSIIFPTITTASDLKSFLAVLESVDYCSLEQQEEFCGAICLGYRMRIGELTSWMTGFGNFDFLPKTRRAPYTEVTFRSKPRPNYEYVLKEAPAGVIHLADMDMKGMQDIQLRSLWEGSFRNTERIIGGKPDLRSAAKTTFAIPMELWKQIS